MKITQVLYSGKGGHGSVVQSFISADKSKEFEHRLIYFGIEELDKGYVEFCHQNQVRYDSILKTEGSHRDSWKAYLKILKSQAPDRILLHSMTLILPTIWYCLFRPARFIAVEHQSNQAKRKSEWLWSFLSLLFASRIVYLTDQYAAEMRKKSGLFFPSRRVNVIPNGIDTDYFSPVPEKEQSLIRIGMASRINLLRDHDTLVRAFEIVAKKNPLAELHIAGDGEGISHLQEIISRSAFKDRIVLHGNLNEPELKAFLSDLSVYVHSTLAETLSTAILQAMSIGLPVIVSEIPGTRNMFERDREGLFFETRNAQELAKKISAILEDRNAGDELGRNARQKCTRDYSSGSMFEKYRKILLP